MAGTAGHEREEFKGKEGARETIAVSMNPGEAAEKERGEERREEWQETIKHNRINK